MNTGLCRAHWCDALCEPNSVLCKKHEAKLSAAARADMHCTIEGALAIVANSRMIAGFEALPEDAKAIAREAAKKA